VARRRIGRPSSPHRQRRILLLVVDLVVHVVGEASFGLAALFGGSEIRPTCIEEIDPLLDALQGLDDLPLEPDEHVDRIFVRSPADIFRVVARLGDDPAALGLRLLGQAALVDEEGSLLLGASDDALGLFFGLLDDALSLGVDPLGGSNFFRDGDTELVDEAEGGRLVDDDVACQREAPAVRDDGLEALDEEDDVDRSALRWRSTGTAVRSARLLHGVTPAEADRVAVRAGPPYSEPRSRSLWIVTLTSADAAP
jgi:hypothetical protein